MATKQSKSTTQNQFRLILAGINKHFPNVTTLTLGGSPVALADLKTDLQAAVDASDASDQSKASWRTVVQAQRNALAKVNPLLRLFKFYVVAQYGDTQNATQTLADFGWTPRKSSTKTVATKAVAVTKTLATRTARHTMGSKQKAKVKGAVSAATAGAPASTGTADGAGVASATSAPVSQSPPTPSEAVTTLAGTSVSTSGSTATKPA